MSDNAHDCYEELVADDATGMQQASGLYIMRLRASGHTLTRRMELLK